MLSIFGFVFLGQKFCGIVAAAALLVKFVQLFVLLLLLLLLLLLHTLRRCGIAFKLIVLHISVATLFPQVFHMLLKQPLFCCCFLLYCCFTWPRLAALLLQLLIAQPKHFNFKGQPFSGRLPLAACLPAASSSCSALLPGHVYVPMMTIAFLLLAAASISFRFVLSFSAFAFGPFPS